MCALIEGFDRVTFECDTATLVSVREAPKGLNLETSPKAARRMLDSGSCAFRDVCGQYSTVCVTEAQATRTSRLLGDAVAKSCLENQFLNSFSEDPQMPPIPFSLG